MAKQINHPTVTNPLGNSCPYCCAALNRFEPVDGALEPIDDDRCIALRYMGCWSCNGKWLDIYDYSREVGGLPTAVPSSG